MDATMSPAYQVEDGSYLFTNKITNNPKEQKIKPPKQYQKPKTPPQNNNNKDQKNEP